MVNVADGEWGCACASINVYLNTLTSDTVCKSTFFGVFFCISSINLLTSGDMFCKTQNTHNDNHQHSLLTNELQTQFSKDN